ncbi:methylated-DNA--protein-cysteine methyltransferase isoform X1 [Felis catus]|nr:methylated-DNA--protein-cysteine methyltransferase isoform X1 [Felis catus]XP_044896776.1 methylated-DNA--protein-cysteine methyltransferase isoform X1 [Felis catus]XP_044896777.1 methylated-DNA--protein-cysteine methyltransferase isoform X1 [Felis catus]XP_044896782.1 methylated-DNA--protein-cysteine methyltransferase isoform X1 [Felis catus]XP_044896783.1 methylated-DNA--protein-cysteine methyltransferase isoform X1 [Felis catus]XP_044896784.1 methylated-DNA--protein-cysteine methyltransf
MDKTCEMSYKVVDSPLGEIEISACEQGVHEIRLHGRKTPDARAVEAPPLPELLGCPGEMTAPLKQCVAWLDAYFHEPAALKDLPLPAIHHPVFQRDSFTRQVLWKLLKVVRLGETVSYRQLAALAGRPRAARAVGGAMRTNPVFHRGLTSPHKTVRQPSGRCAPPPNSFTTEDGQPPVGPCRSGRFSLRDIWSTTATSSHPHPVPQSGLQQWSRGQLLRRPGHEGVASRPRGPPGREAELSGRLPWGWHPPPPACWRNGGLVGVNT